MKKSYQAGNILHLSLLTGSLLFLSGCHDSGPAATAEIDLPTVELSVMLPEVLTDGSIRIHSDQLVQHIGTKGVFILSSRNQARFRMVKTGKKKGDSISITSGLKGQEQILTGPYDSVVDGSPVQLRKEQLRIKQ